MSSDDLQHRRHSLAHLLGAALVDLYPGTKLAIGPATDDGFYYDCLPPSPLSADDLPSIEQKMRDIAKGWTTFERQAVSANEARDLFKDNPYKHELIDQFSSEGQELSTYTAGDFVDLCGGGHADHMKEVCMEGFELQSVAGAYWRGDEKNDMLTRVYGLAFDSQKDLESHKHMLEEAKKRDHRVLGKSLGLFSFSKLVGPGLPLFSPRGTALRSAVEQALSSLLDRYGYERIWIPHLAKQDLYERSGHWDKFGDELFSVQGRHDTFVLKPMNCPHHTQVYASSPKSYHDLPVRYAEHTTVYRDEQKGELLGLTRVLSLTQDDGHIFCTPDQIGEEVSSTISLIETWYKALGFFQGDDCTVLLSVRGDDKEKYLGDDAVWQRAEQVLGEALREKGLPFTEEPGEAAFYGPKIDFHFKDSLGRTWQLATIQLDFVMPERFSLTYTDRDGKKKTPVMIHRAVSGSIERFLGIMIEHFAGHFPFFLSPLQVRVLPIGPDAHEYAQTVLSSLRSAGIRADADLSQETLGKRIAKVHGEKVPYRIVVGTKEAEKNEVTLEGAEEKQVMSLEACSQLLAEKNRPFTEGA